MKIDVFVFIESELSLNRSTSKVMWQSGEIVCIISSLCLGNIYIVKKCHEVSMLQQRHKGMSAKFFRYIS